MKKILRRAVATVSLVIMAAVPLQAANALTTSDIIKNGEVKIGVLTGMPPYTTVDSTGQPGGFLVDLAKAVAQTLDVKLRVVPVNNSSRAAALQSGRVDILIAQMTATPKRALTFLMTNPYGAYVMSFVAAKDTKLTSEDDLAGKRVSVPTGSTQDVAVSRIAKKENGMKVVRFPDDASAFQALLSGQVDVTAQVGVVATNVIKVQGLSNLEVKEELPLYTLYWSMAVRKGDTELHQWLNNFIYYYEVTGKLDELHKKWVGVPIPGGKLPTF